MFKIKLILFVILSLMITGCGQTRILEKLGFIQSVAYDLIEKEENGNKVNYLQVTNSIPEAQPKIKKEREVLSTISKTSKEARIDLSRQTDRVLVSGQIRSALFGLSLAKNGLLKYIDTFGRDPSIGQNVKIVIVNGSAHDLLSKDYPQHPRTGQYIDHLISKEAEGQGIPKVNLYHFTRDLFDDGIEPVAPVISEEKDNIRIEGIGLFRKDKYITKIPYIDSVIFAFLRRDFKEGEVSIDLTPQKPTEKEIVMFSSLNSHRKIKVNRPSGSQPYVVNINVNAKGSILEYTGKQDPGNAKDQKKLEKMMSQRLSDRAQRLVEFMQDNKLDSIGVGQYVRNQMSYKEWTAKKWEDEFPNVKINCNINIQIKDYGKLK